MERYDLIAADSVQIPNIYSIGFSSDTKVTRFSPSIRNQYIIHYVLSGKGYFNGNKVEKGQGFLIVPGMHEEYHPDKDEPWSFLWIISGDLAMQPFFDKHCADEKTNIFNFHNLYEFQPIVDKLLSAKNRPYSAAQLSELFLHIFNSCVVSENTPLSPLTKRYFDFSVNYVKTNLHLPISVQDLCSVIGITQPYLYRVFNQEIGISPKQYILRCKINEAKKLLANTEFSISLIANSVGYENVLEFSKFFKKQTGLSPTSYKKALASC